LLVVFWWQRGKLSWKRDVLPLMPFFIAGMGAGLFTAWVERKFIGAAGAEFHFSIIERFLIAGRAIGFYLGKLFWPVDLVFIYPRWNVSQSVGWQYLFPAAALLWLGVLVWRRWRGPLAGLLFFVGTLFPALGFFNVYPFRYSLVADHFQYLASLGPLILAAAGMTALPGLLRTRKPFLEPMVCATLLLVLGTLTWQQCGMYVDDETLWQATLRRNPDCWMAHNNLGFDLLTREGQVEEAIAHCRKALEIKPDYAEPHHNLGLAFFQQGRLDEAVSQYQQALEIKPDLTPAHFNLGIIFFQQGRLNEAITHYQKVLETKPNNAVAHNNLGLSFFLVGRMGEAISQYQKALEIKPDYAEAQKNLAWVFATCPQAALRNGNKAVELAERANQLAGGDDLLILRALAAAYAEAGRFSEAVETAQRALPLAEAQSNTMLAGQLKAQLKLYQSGNPFHSHAQTH
jgi:tetratricopeptide (TPR) repeat protein